MNGGNLRNVEVRNEVIFVEQPQPDEIDGLEIRKNIRRFYQPRNDLIKGNNCKLNYYLRYFV
jgi:hypothetical protein